LRLGRASEAGAEIERFLQLSPGNAEGLAVQAEIEERARRPAGQ